MIDLLELPGQLPRDVLWQWPDSGVCEGGVIEGGLFSCLLSGDGLEAGVIGPKNVPACGFVDSSDFSHAVAPLPCSAYIDDNGDGVDSAALHIVSSISAVAGAQDECWGWPLVVRNSFQREQAMKAALRP